MTEPLSAKVDAHAARTEFVSRTKADSERVSAPLTIVTKPQPWWDQDNRVLPKHAFVPDPQIKEGVPLQHLRAAALYLCDKKPDVIVLAMDWFDFPSLSYHDIDHADYKTRSTMRDFRAGLHGWDTFMAPIRAERDLSGWTPTIICTEGNHDARIWRHLIEDARPDEAMPTPRQVAEADGCLWYPFLTPVDVDGVLYCLTPETPILKADLTYSPIGALRVGDRLAAFTEEPVNGAARAYKEAQVTAVDPVVAEVCKIRLTDGTEFKATEDHRWLARTPGNTGWGWRRTVDLRVGTEVCRAFPTWERDTSYEAGYLAGIFDGEGHLHIPKGQGGAQLAFAQRPGPVLDKACKILSDWGVPYSVHGCGGTNGDVCSVRILGTMGDKLGLLGRIGADRLIGKVDWSALGRFQNAGPAVSVESVEGAGRGTVIQIATTTGTLIARGFGHHNCHYFANPMTGRPYGGMMETRLKTVGRSFSMGHQQTYLTGMLSRVDGSTLRGLVAGSFYMHDETYKGAQGNKHWRGMLIKHAVRDGNYNLMELDIPFLLRRHKIQPILADGDYMKDELGWDAMLRSRLDKPVRRKKSK